jgi:hypothetical protein
VDVFQFRVAVVLVIVLCSVSTLSGALQDRPDVSAVLAKPPPPRGAEKGSMEAVEALRVLLNRKDHEGSWFAEYALNLGPLPRPAGWTEKRRFLSRGSNDFYSEMVAENEASKVLLRKGVLQWEYFSSTYGSDYFTSPVRLNGKSPEKWLKAHDFIVNTFGDMDESIIVIVRNLLSGSRVLRQDDKGAQRSWVFSTQDDRQLRVTISPGHASIRERRVADGAGPEMVRLRYSYQEGLTGWESALPASLLGRFAGAEAAKVHRLSVEINMMEQLDRLFAGERQIREITPQEGRERCRRFHFLFPKAGPFALSRAQTYQGQLTLTVKLKRGKQYEISQFPAANRFDIPEHFIKRRRTMRDYTVLEVHDPGTGSRNVYYLKKGYMLIVGPNRISFNDPDLDHLIVTFAPVVADRPQVGAGAGK